MVSPTWKDQNNIPTVDMSFMMGFPPGSFMMPVSDALPFVEAIVSNFVKNGLVGLELKNDGTFGVQYRFVTFSDDILQDFLQGPTFSDEIFLFPGPDQTGGIDLVTFIPDVLSSLEIKIFIKKK